MGGWFGNEEVFLFPNLCCDFIQDDYSSVLTCYYKMNEFKTAPRILRLGIQDIIFSFAIYAIFIIS